MNGPYPEITNISFLAKLFFKTFISLKHLSDCRIIATAPVVCQMARLVVCQVARLVVCQVTRLVVCQVARLVCQVARLVVCQVTRLVVCQVTRLLSVKLLDKLFVK